MYRSYSADDWRNYLKLPDDYRVDGVLMFGSNESYAYDLFENALKRSGTSYELKRLDGEYLQAIYECTIENKKLWFFVAYGSAQLSEFLHLACSFGSKTNILLGNCGGLKQGVEAYDLVIPTYSYATESSATTYQPDVANEFESNNELSAALASQLIGRHSVHRGKTMTCQAMFGEGNEHIEAWSQEGYLAVEMEAATVFAVSNYFNIPSAAIVKVIDNLAKHETIVENGYDPAEKSHDAIAGEMFDVALVQLLHDA